MYSNNIVNFQESTTILNACTKKSGNLLKAPRIYIWLFHPLLSTYDDQIALVISCITDDISDQPSKLIRIWDFVVVYIYKSTKDNTCEMHQVSQSAFNKSPENHIRIKEYHGFVNCNFWIKFNAPFIPKVMKFSKRSGSFSWLPRHL